MKPFFDKWISWISKLRLSSNFRSYFVRMFLRHDTVILNIKYYFIREITVKLCFLQKLNKICVTILFHWKWTLNTSMKRNLKLYNLWLYLTLNVSCDEKINKVTAQHEIQKTNRRKIRYTCFTCCEKEIDTRII